MGFCNLNLGSGALSCRGRLPRKDREMNIIKPKAIMRTLDFLVDNINVFFKPVLKEKNTFFDHKYQENVRERHPHYKI
jgi:hypothetical protein